MDTTATTTVVMSLRERLMEYFKGGCVSRLVDSSFVHVNRTERTQRGSLAQVEHERDGMAIISIFDVPIMAVGKHPKRVELFSSLDRSPQFRDIKAQLEDFMSVYLQGVEIQHREGTVDNYA